MFLGHFGVGFGGKRAAPRTSHGTLFLAAQFIDLLWPTSLLLHIERIEISPGISRFTPLGLLRKRVRPSPSKCHFLAVGGSSAVIVRGMGLLD